MPSNLKRFHTFGHNHVVTFSCYRRLPYLNDNHSRTTFLNILEQIRERHQFYVFGYVVMPEHIHLLIGEPKAGKLEDTFRALKTQTSRKLKGERSQFWQRRYHDFNVFTQPKFVEKLQYIHRNPVERGLVDKAEDWPWSSCRHWLTGEQSEVKIESHWAWQKLERLNAAQASRLHSSQRK